MTINRVTQNMMSQSSLTGLQTGLSKLARIQEQLATGRVINRVSDSPADATSAMRMRSAIAEQQQYARNGQDGLGWLGQIDSTLMAVTDDTRRVRDLALTARNAATSPAGREAIAAEIDQIRSSLLSSANTTYVGRPVFGGVTAGAQAYDATGAYVGTPGAVQRVVGDGVTVDVQVAGPDVFGTAPGTLFDDLTALSAAIRANDGAGMDTGITALSASMDRITTKLADVGTRYARIEKAIQIAVDAELSMTNSLSEIENTDLPKAMVELQMQEVAYQAALASTARVLQPSLLDFLR